MPAWWKACIITTWPKGPVPSHLWQATAEILTSSYFNEQKCSPKKVWNWSFLLLFASSLPCTWRPTVVSCLSPTVKLDPSSLPASYFFRPAGAQQTVAWRQENSITFKIIPLAFGEYKESPTTTKFHHSRVH